VGSAAPSFQYSGARRFHQRLFLLSCRLTFLLLVFIISARVDFGNFQDSMKIKLAKRDRHRFGAFYYRFPHGESGSDVSVMLGACVRRTNVCLYEARSLLLPVLTNCVSIVHALRFLIVSRPFWILCGDRLT
jgi:hypothetical protein